MSHIYTIYYQYSGWYGFFLELSTFDSSLYFIFLPSLYTYFWYVFMGLWSQHNKEHLFQHSEFSERLLLKLLFEKENGKCLCLKLKCVPFHFCFSTFIDVAIISVRVEGVGARCCVVMMSKLRWMREQPSETSNS